MILTMIASNVTKVRSAAADSARDVTRDAADSERERQHPLVYCIRLMILPIVTCRDGKNERDEMEESEEREKRDASDERRERSEN